MNTRIILAALGIAVLVGGAFWLGTAHNAEAPVETVDDTAMLESDSPIEDVATTTPEETVAATTPAPAPVQPKTQTPSAPVKTTPPPAAQTAPSYAVITYDGRNFSPNEITITLGGTVRFLNLSDEDMWIASDLHPIHSGYQVKDSKNCSGWAFDMCESVGKGGAWNFTFERAGKFGFHNHMRAADNGRIIVKDPEVKPSIPGY